MGLKDLFVKKKKEAPKPFHIPPSGDKPFSLGSLPEPGRRDLQPIKEMTFPKIPESKPLDFPRPAPLKMPSVEETRIPEPHLFVKVDKYQQVRESSRRLADKLKDLTGVLGKLEDLKREEEAKLKVLKDTLKNMSDSASELDKTFRAAREEYE